MNGASNPVSLADRIARCERGSEVQQVLKQLTPGQQLDLVPVLVERLRDCDRWLARNKFHLHSEFRRDQVQSAGPETGEAGAESLPPDGRRTIAAAENCVAGLNTVLGSVRDLSTREFIALVQYAGGGGNLVRSLDPKAMVTLLERFLNDTALSDDLKPYLRDYAGLIAAADAKLARRLESVLAAPQIRVYPGEAWSDAALADLKTMASAVRRHWVDLLVYCERATAAAPSAKWLKNAQTLVAEVGQDEFRNRVLNWFPLVDQPRTAPLERGWDLADPDQLIIEPHARVLKGLAWCCSLQADRDLARSLAALTLSTYRKIPLKGPREPAIGNAGITALGMMPGLEGVHQLALLKVKIRSGSGQKIVEKAFNTTANRVGLPRDELLEIAVPAYGLTSVGVREEDMGEFKARLTVTGTTRTDLVWIKADGKVQRGIPASVKASHKEELKELQAAAKDIQKMLPAQRERMDSLFLQQKTWPLAVWRERYLDHPLVGTLARRILWDFNTGEQAATGIWFDGRLVDVDLKPVALSEGQTTVRLWHPIGRSAGEVVAWRGWLDAQQVQQPFRQAHREVYLLTDAERQTQIYSNRFAAHVLRQHQFRALATARGWQPPFLGGWDGGDEGLARRELADGWRVEFWIYAAVGEQLDSGGWTVVSTDQVRFYHGTNTGPERLENVPPLILSEALRDVDLFVGVASVGNDPTWSDGGPEGRFQQYWQAYSFGALNESAKTRKEVLERLVPRLKIAGQCSFAERFLIVKGSLRTYKIHLGSGNILMAPNDQYLCIVPRPGDADDGGVLLPFEGDRTLSVILSKAFLLAEDDQIKDETIRRQIDQK